jgi:riboflavin synthase
MFTGIVEELGTLERLSPISQGRHLRISARRILEDLSPEDSVAVCGVCLTVTKVGKTFFEATAVEETLRRSTISEFKMNQKVNLERALRLNDRLGGHLVLGHIDGIGTVRSIVNKGTGKLFEIILAENLSRYIVEKGSIALDGVSLTVTGIHDNRVGVAVVPYTLQNTTFGLIHTGQKLNVELDIIGKYVEKLLQPAEAEERMGETWLRKLGY